MNEIDELKRRIKQLEEENDRLKRSWFRTSSDLTVSVPKVFEPIFVTAQNLVADFFKEIKADPSKGRIDVGIERYILVRASALSINFFETMQKVYADRGPEEAARIGRRFLFDIGHAIGMNDARNLHKRMNLTEPVQKLSAGPVHFAYTGWAFVNIRSESNPSPDDDFVLVYDHPYSFEADSWLAAGRKTDETVCIMNAGYSSGWCEESFGLPLTAVEVLCRARGDKTCTFIMAPPHRIFAQIQKNFGIDIADKSCTRLSVPSFFERKQIEERLNRLLQFQNQMLDTAAIWIDTLDIDGRVTFWNRAAERISGYTKEEVLNNANIWEWLYPDSKYRKTITDQANKIIRKGHQVENFETTIQCKNGEKKVISWCSNNLFDNDGKVIGSIALGADITERKSIEEKITASEEKYRRLVENLSQEYFFYQHGIDGVFTYVSPSIKNMLGYTPAEFMIHYKDTLTDNPINDEVVKHSELSIKGIRQPLYEAEVYHKDRSRRILEIVEMPIKNKDGDVIAVEGIAHDITLRKTAEESLRESEHRLADILQFFPDPTLVIDCNGKVTAWNRAIEEMTGVKAEDILGKGNYEYSIPFYGNRRPILIDLALRVNEVIEKEYAHLERRGDVISGEAYTRNLPSGRHYLYATATPLRNPDGEIIGAIESIRDISDRKLTEEELRKEKDFRQTLVEASPAYFVAIKADGTTLMMNVALLKALGYKAEEAIGKDYLKAFVPEKDQAIVNRVFKKILSSREPIEAVNRIVAKSGKQLLVEWHGRCIYNENDEVDYFIGFGIDITARRQAEEQLKETLDELRRSNRELEEFAYVASHDLQEPLRKVLTFSDRLKEKSAKEIGEQGLDYLERMQSAVGRMQNLINDLLTYSRVSSKAKPFEPVDLNIIMRQVLEDLESRIRPGMDRVEVEDLPTIDAEPRQMHQLFQNLIGNALKFKRPDEAAVVKVTVQKDENKYHFMVKDNGIGFEEKYSESIFSIFKRLHARSEYEGTGVGLAICKKIVTRHNGSIKATSKPGEGATFYFILPVRQEQGSE